STKHLMRFFEQPLNAEMLAAKRRAHQHHPRNLTLNDAGQSTESAPKVYEKLFLSLGQPAVVTPKIFSAGIAVIWAAL
ncbi:hypothetical protein, partial [Rhabdochromatium marinum]|uniref:hypothetical protein n=1 Tax=Rhabdochromatium marinum TaxID=48729 RepID=UPI001A90CD2E